MDNYLRLKDSTTYLRRRVPDKLRAKVGRTEINIRIGVIPRKHASVLALAFASQCGLLFERCRHQTLSGEMIKAEIHRILVQTKLSLEEIMGQNDAKSAMNGRLHALPVEEDILADGEVAQNLITAHDAGTFAYDDEFVRTQLEKSGIDTNQDPLAYKQLAGQMTLVLAHHLFQRSIAKTERNALDSGPVTGGSNQITCN